MASQRCGLLTVAVLLGGATSPHASAQSIDAIFKDFANAQTPGCAVGATHGAAPLAAGAYGMADLEHRVPLTPQSVVYLASLSKQFTALSILLLERDGKLHLDDRVRTYIPELPLNAAGITIRQLLHHTSGIRDYFTLSRLAGNPPDFVITERYVLNMLARQTRLNYEPGTEHLYSNSGYVLLSIIVHRVAGRTLDEFARERIFAPLSMRSTRFQHDHTSPIPGRANGYVREGETWRIANSLLDVVGDGGVYSTIDDMLRWASAFDRPDFAPHLARMATPGTLADGRPIANGYGMGLAQGTYRGTTMVSHSGGLAGYRTDFFRLPAERLTVVTLCNNATANAGWLAQSVADLYLPAGPLGTATTANVSGDVPPATPAQAPVPRALGVALAGMYRSDELDATYRIASSSGETSLQVGNSRPVALFMVGPNQLVAPSAGLQLTPVRDRAGRVTGLTLAAGRVRDISFVRR